MLGSSVTGFEMGSGFSKRDISKGYVYTFLPFFFLLKIEILEFFRGRRGKENFDFSNELSELALIQ